MIDDLYCPYCECDRFDYIDDGCGGGLYHRCLTCFAYLKKEDLSRERKLAKKEVEKKGISWIIWNYLGYGQGKVIGVFDD